MHLRQIDLNLAVVLHALFEERSVSRAARRLGLSQSATSHALARLRETLGDPLFVRAPGGLVPTTRAEAIRSSLASGLAALEQSFQFQPKFDPATARHTFRIGSSDYAEHVIMPALLTRMATIAPNLDVWASSAPLDTTEALAGGALDLVLAPKRVGDERVDGLYTAELWSDHFVGVVRRGHPLMRGKLTLDRFARARHAFIAPRGRPGGVVDDALRKRGRARRIAFTTANFLVAPQVVAETDLVLTLAARVARSFAESMPLTLFEPPLALAGFQVSMFWHERMHADPAHQFLRAELVRAARALPVSTAPARRKRS